MTIFELLGFVGFLLTGILIDCCFSLRRRIIDLESRVTALEQHDAEPDDDEDEAWRESLNMTEDHDG